MHNWVRSQIGPSAKEFTSFLELRPGGSRTRLKLYNSWPVPNGCASCCLIRILPDLSLSVFGVHAPQDFEPAALFWKSPAEVHGLF